MTIKITANGVRLGSQVWSDGILFGTVTARVGNLLRVKRPDGSRVKVRPEDVAFTGNISDNQE